MDRMATRVVTWAMVAGVAAFACASARAEVLPGPTVPAGLVAQAGAGPEFRAHRPVRLASTTDGPTSEAPLSFGRRQPTPAATATAAPSATPAPAPASGPSSMNPAKKPVASEPAAPTAPEASAGSPAPANIATPSATRPANDAALRDEEARALARLRARLEETLKQHSGIDARVKARRDGLRVVSHGPAEPSPQDVASAVRNPAAARAAAQARRYASVSPARPAGSTEFRDWSYRGETGPEHWARLNPEWASCGADVPQAPIDIRDGVAVRLPPIEFDLPPAQLTIRDDGRAIRAVVREGPGIVTLGRRFELREITFHQPAEFRVEGRSFDLSAHLLHRDEQGRAAVIVVLFEIGDEATPRNPVVQTVLDYLPLAQDMLMPVPDRRDLSQLLPADPGYYNFIGALSSPPCTEGVVWMVMREPVRIPPSQVAIFARIHPMNVRPLQPLAGRLIKQSE